MPRISEIINPAFRSGVSAKTQKPWVLMQVRTDDGTEATIFAPAVIGDEVELKYNTEYKNWNAEKVTQAKREFAEIHEKLDKILALLKPTLPMGLPDEAPFGQEDEPPFPMEEIPF